VSGTRSVERQVGWLPNPAGGSAKATRSAAPASVIAVRLSSNGWRRNSWIIPAYRVTVTGTPGCLQPSAVLLAFVAQRVELGGDDHCLGQPGARLMLPYLPPNS
jgi:hypothetical protein